MYPSGTPFFLHSLSTLRCQQSGDWYRSAPKGPEGVGGGAATTPATVVALSVVASSMGMARAERRQKVPRHSRVDKEDSEEGILIVRLVLVTFVCLLQDE